MSKVATNRHIDLTALPFEASTSGGGGVWEVEADVPEADLRAAVDAAPDYVEPAPKSEQLADIRTKVEALPQNNPARAIFLDLIDAV